LKENRGGQGSRGTGSMVVPNSQRFDDGFKEVNCGQEAFEKNLSSSFMIETS